MLYHCDVQAEWIVEGYTVDKMAAVGMCDQDPNSVLPILSDVEHIDQLSDNIGALFLQDSYSDITLIVDGQRFVAHKVVLAARSEYFRLVTVLGVQHLILFLLHIHRVNWRHRICGHDAITILWV